jgi:hypothetical protein
MHFFIKELSLRKTYEDWSVFIIFIYLSFSPFTVLQKSIFYLHTVPSKSSSCEHNIQSRIHKHYHASYAYIRTPILSIF